MRKAESQGTFWEVLNKTDVLFGGCMVGDLSASRS